MLIDDPDLTNKTAIVTGASRGIGKAAVERFAKAGANVVLLSRSENELQKFVAEIGDNAMSEACDVSNWSEVSEP